MSEQGKTIGKLELPADEMLTAVRKHKELVARAENYATAQGLTAYMQEVLGQLVDLDGDLHTYEVSLDLRQEWVTLNHAGSDLFVTLTLIQARELQNILNRIFPNEQ